MQGTFINGSRPKTKKALKEQVEGINLWEEHGGDPESIRTLELNYVMELAKDPKQKIAINPQDPYSVVLEATSVFGNEFDGSLAKAMKEMNYGPFYVVGPDPYNKRNWYATIEYNKEKGKWIVK